MLKKRSMSHVLSESPGWLASGSSPRELSRIYREQIRYVWRSLRHLGVHPSDLEDVAHEVFLVVGRKLDTFEHRSTLRTWIYGICIRTASDYRSKACRRREVLHDELPDSARAPEQEGTVGRGRLRDQLNRLLDSLAPEQREVFVLYEIEELPMREVAQAIGCPLQTAYSRLHAARRLLKNKLAQEGVAP